MRLRTGQSFTRDSLVVLFAFAVVATLSVPPIFLRAGEPTAPETAKNSPRPMVEPLPVAEVRRTSPVSFETEILPILRKNCLACHKAGDPAGDLVLPSPDLIRAGGEHGPAVVPGKSGESRLFRLASHQLEPIMPPADNKVGASPSRRSNSGW